MPAERGPSGTGGTAAKGEIVDFEALCASCGHAAKLHHPMTPLRTCAAMVYTDAPIGGGSCYPCRCRGFVPPDPPVAVPGPASVSPADTIRLKAAAEAALPGQIDGGWYETDSLAIDSVDRPDAVFIAAATPQLILALLAVGERDKAEIEAGQLNADVVADVHGLRDRLADWVIGDGTMISLRDVLDELCRILDPTVPPAGERDRQQIARLTEALKQIAVEIRPGTLAASLSADQHVAALWEVVRHYSATARAVLAGEEDAGDG